MTDEEIVTMTLRDRAFFGHIVERYEAPLARYVRRLGVRVEEDREDVLQEIFIKVYRNLHGFDTKLKFSSWIYRIAHNEAISWYRKTTVRPEGHLIDNGDDVLQFLEANETNQEAQFDQTINADAVAVALHGIDEKYRSVILLRYFEHKEYDEISDILKIPTGTVGTLIHRGKKQLRANLDAEKLRV